MKKPRANSREKILAAAADVARESGPGNLSLDAVAQRAGVSKGGLLYNFPTKAKLMQALVEHYLSEFQESLELARQACGQGNLLAAYVKLSAKKFEEETSRLHLGFSRRLPRIPISLPRSASFTASSSTG